MTHKVMTKTLMLKLHVKKFEQNYFQKVRVKNELSKLFMYVILKTIVIKY